MLPKQFNEFGVLSQDYETTFAELGDSLLVRGPEPALPNWNAVWRRTLLDNVEILVRQLWTAGIQTVYIDGSFVQDKGHPNDVDGCFECDYAEWKSGTLEKRLNEAAPKKVWTWEDSRLVLGVPRLPMWASYRVELYPYCHGVPHGMVVDGELVPYPDAFRFSRRAGLKKGILKLKNEEVLS